MGERICSEGAYVPYGCQARDANQIANTRTVRLKFLNNNPVLFDPVR